MFLLVISYNEFADDTSSLLFVNLAFLVVSFAILFKRLQSGFMFTRKLNKFAIFMEANLAMTCIVTIISQLFELESDLLFGIEVCLLYLCGGFGFFWLADLLERRELLKGAAAAEQNSKSAIRILYLIACFVELVEQTDQMADYILQSLVEEHMETCDFA